MANRSNRHAVEHPSANSALHLNTYRIFYLPPETSMCCVGRGFSVRNSDRKSFPTVLRFRLFYCLPLHVVRGVGAASLEWHHVVDHISRTRPGGFARGR